MEQKLKTPELPSYNVKPNYTEFWQKYGGFLKWSATVINLIISITIINELVELSKLEDGALAQWQLSIGAKFVFLSLPASCFVFVFTLLSLRLDSFRNQIVKQAVYLFCATSSLALPVILFRNINVFIK